MQDNRGNFPPGRSFVGTPFTPPTHDSAIASEPDYGAPHGERPEFEEFPMKTCKFYISVLISGETEGDIQKVWDRVRKAIDSIEDIDDYYLEDSEMLDD